jgi:nucleoside-diphosphate-sugar epimerase
VRVLVTGGNGFLGRHVVAALRERGRTVRVLDVAPALDATAGVEQVTADLVTSPGLDAACAGVDVVVHLAARMRGSGDEIVNGTVEGSRRLLEAMARSGTSRLVLASSFSVYDWSRLAGPLDERTPTLDAAEGRRGDPYARAKTLQERLAREHAVRYGWTLTILRPAVLWGRGVWGEFMLGRRIGPLQLVVAPRAPIRLLYVENAADAFAQAAERTDPGEQVYNLIDPQDVSTWRFAGIVKSGLGGVRAPVPYRLGLWLARIAAGLLPGPERLPYLLDPVRFEALHRPARCDAQRARESLGWRPRFGFEAALLRVRAARA